MDKKTESSEQQKTAAALFEKAYDWKNPFPHLSTRRANMMARVHSDLEATPNPWVNPLANIIANWHDIDICMELLDAPGPLDLLGGSSMYRGRGPRAIFTDDIHKRAKALNDISWYDRFQKSMAVIFGPDIPSKILGLYSSSMLRRMVAVRDFLDREKEAYGEPNILFDTTTRAPFAAMELLKRIHDVDPIKAKEVFGKILSGDVSHRDVQAIHQELSGTSGLQQRHRYTGPASAGLGARAGRGQVNAFYRIGEEVVRRNLPSLTDDSQARFYLQSFRFQYASPLAVALRFKDNGIAWVDAFDFRRPNTRPYKLALAEVAFAATFFRNYWIIVDAKDDIADVFIRDVRALGLHSVGIAEIDTDDPEKFRIHQKPELAAQPDRQAQTVREIMGQGIPDLVEF